ncbi:hypothetical protein GCM10011371_33580 [Novosphingobium marinum]|uniref:Uncharacterized protein n=2 Tax=Novosphingobium marinum TaxID=1514948 RepID=A0A7Y9Y1V2_9SPHN|nr:hypothetical protein [Novosphingobium marinum]NYH97081.1 hypothetical protein [Novosphingobium marinum]GGC43428.1 hypothetical protein GCM10011371_33580 [Novosphingobium marinum]
MREGQADEMIALLGAIAEELRGLRDEFDKFTGYNTTTMSEAVDRITGPLGYTIGDLQDKLIAIEVNTEA